MSLKILYWVKVLKRIIYEDGYRYETMYIDKMVMNSNVVSVDEKFTRGNDIILVFERP